MVELIGTKDVDWVALTAGAFLYPAGSALTWHTDSKVYSGAFTYYVHPKWNCQWGGELLVADESCEGADLNPPPLEFRDWTGRVVSTGGVIGPSLDNERENAVLEKSAGGVTSLRNRIASSLFEVACLTGSSASMPPQEITCGVRSPVFLCAAKTPKAAQRGSAPERDVSNSKSLLARV